MAGLIPFAMASMLFSPQLGNVLPGNQPFLRLFLVRSVAVQTFVFMDGKKAAIVALTLLARLLSPPPNPNTSFRVGRPCVLLMISRPAIAATACLRKQLHGNSHQWPARHLLLKPLGGLHLGAFALPSPGASEPIGLQACQPSLHMKMWKGISFCVGSVSLLLWQWAPACRAGLTVS